MISNHMQKVYQISLDQINTLTKGNF